MSGGDEDPNALRRRLGEALRRYRTASGLTQRQVTEALDFSRSKMARLESGSHGISLTDLDALLALYGVDNARVMAELRDVARGGRGQPWWGELGDIVSEQFARYLAYESEAVEFRIAHPHLVPGLLHVPAYAEDLLMQHSSPDRVRRIAELRRRRQERIIGQAGISCNFIVTEASFHMWAGGRDGMREQLQHLLEVGRQPGVAVRIVPASAGAHVGLAGPFNLLTLAGEAGKVLFRESFIGDRLARDSDAREKEIVRTFEGNFAELWDGALPVSQGEDLLKHEIERLGQAQ